MIHFDFARLVSIGLTQTFVQQLYTQTYPDNTQLYRVVDVQREHLMLHDGCDSHFARPHPSLIRSLLDEFTVLAVGDWVLAERRDHQELWVTRRLDPINHLSRRNADGISQAVASNIDTALIVMGLDLDYNLRRLERFLAIAITARINPVVVLTKADLATDLASQVDAVRQRVPPHIEVLAINGLSTTTRQQLVPWLTPGQTLVLIGSSGAGKSTLTNTLTESNQQNTGSVREDDGRGRHTTTSRSLHRCPGGACIIDTPGIRTLRPDADEATVGASFEDITSLAEQCRFKDCKHLEEPGCAVRDAIPPDRLRNYHKLLREVRRDQMTALEYKEQVAKWKARSRASRATIRAKGRIV